MDHTPVRPEVTTRLASRADAAVKSGVTDVYAVFPEVSSERTLTLTIDTSAALLMTLAAKDSTTGEGFALALRSAMTLCAATGYAIGMEVYDERATALLSDMFPDGES